MVSKTEQIEFDDKLNLADRVLTEFSPWKKCCEFDSGSGVYILLYTIRKKMERSWLLDF